MSYISFEDVTKEYQMGGEKVLAANGVSFEMEQGELAVVLGPSGAGKTTILNLLGGMDKVTSGKIVVGGKEITGLENGQVPGAADVTVYHAGTAIKDGKLVTNGGRVLGVTATGPRLTNALSHAYEAAEKISFEKLHKRSDIGLRALKALAEKQ